MTALLFVCTANVSRSPFAELLARSRVGDATRLRSAGTHGTDGREIDPEIAAQLAGRGIDATGFRSTRLTPALLAEADLVLTAGAEHRRFVLEEAPTTLRRTFTLGQVARALDEVPGHLAGAELWAAAHRARPTADPQDDVVDPYGRGTDAAATAAEHLETLLDRVLPRLVLSA